MAYTVVIHLYDTDDDVQKVDGFKSKNEVISFICSLAASGGYNDCMIAEISVYTKNGTLIGHD